MTEPKKYPVTIDYARSFDVMVATVPYDWLNGDINSKNFTIEGKGVVTLDLELVYLNNVVSTEEVEAYLETNGLRPATLEELLAFGATYPDVQQNFPVIALGSSWVNRYGLHLVPYLNWYGYERYLNLNLRSYNGPWSELFRFLAVRK